MPNNLYTCPVCGYTDLIDPPYDKYGCASYEICPCCGVEFGYDDATESHSVLREKWVATGMKWWSKSVNPPYEWSAMKQIDNFLKIKSK